MGIVMSASEGGGRVRDGLAQHLRRQETHKSHVLPSPYLAFGNGDEHRSIHSPDDRRQVFIFLKLFLMIFLKASIKVHFKSF